MSVESARAAERVSPLAATRLSVPAAVINLIVLIGVVVTLVPYLYMLSAGFKTNSEIFGYPVTLWPRQFILSNLFFQRQFIEAVSSGAFKGV